MADPVSAMAALGLAANISQMIEYAISIVSKSRELRKSLDGALSENRHTAVVTKSLYNASSTLSSYIDDYKSADKALSPQDERLKEISHTCTTIASSLIKELDQLKLKSDDNTKWHSFRQALKAVWGKGRLDILANTLEMYRNDLKTILQISILKRLDVTQTRLAGLDQTSQKILEETQSSRKMSENNFNVLLQHVRSPIGSSTDRKKELIRCSSVGDVGSLGNLILQGVSLEATDEHEFTALMTASRWGHSECVRFLLSGGAQVEAHDSTGATSLVLAAAEGHDGVINLLLDSGARNEGIVGHGPYTAVVTALTNRHWRTADLLYKRCPSFLGLLEVLLRAAEDGDIDTVSWLIEAGIDTDKARNQYQRNALALASLESQTPMVDLLLSARSCTEIKGNHGNTALQYAAQAGAQGVVKALLQAGTNVNTMNVSGYTPLAEAAQHGWHNVIDELVAAGAYLETKDDGQYTPLCRVAQRSQIMTVTNLLKHGANPNARNRDGWTALAEACFHGKTS